MNNQLCRIVMLLGLLAGMVFPPAETAGAQNGAEATLFALQADQFPEITAYLDIRDAQGQFVQGLHPRQVTVVEDGRPFSISSLEALEPGAQFVLAINPGRSFSIRDGQGISRYDLVVDKLQAWAENRPNTEDDFSLLMDEGPEILHVSSAVEITKALSDYEGDFRNDEPNLEVLTRALEIVSEESLEQGVGRAILFVTSSLDSAFAMGLETIASQAVQQGVRISVWFVSSPDFFSSRSYGLLQEMVDRTGGSMAAFSGTESLPDPEIYLNPLREIYRVSYISGITTGGEHPVFLEINHENQTIVSSVQSYFMEISPPNPILISPPSLINRITRLTDSSGEPDLDPDTQLLEILVEYTDGFPRELVASFLYVDGIIVAENAQAPFDRFSWDVSRYFESGTKMVSVQVVDSQGLSGISSEIPVEIVVTFPPQSIWFLLTRHAPQLALVVVAFSGAILLLVLVLGGRIRPKVFGRIQDPNARPPGFRIKKSFPATFSSEPLTQPVKGMESRENHPRRLTQWINRLHWPQRQAAAGAYGFLTRLPESKEMGTVRPIPLTDEEIQLGKDPLKVNMVIEDPSLDGLHALIRREDSSFRLSDAGTVAGTWVNYSPVSREGVLLEHGDIVHIGRVGFRFTLREPDRLRKPSVVRKESDR